MKTVVGRELEIEQLQHILAANEAQFVAVYGRRRVGKTFLINQFFKDQGVYMEVTGTKDGSYADQLANFIDGYSETFHEGVPLRAPKNWREAFSQLTKKLETIPSSQKIILFFDELPWLATKRSKFVQSLDYVWNRHWSRMENVRVIACGSAAAWMLEKLINAKGGLYNRLTHIMHLQPYNLAQTKQFIRSKGLKLSHKQLLDVYMIMGGIPFYLNQLRSGVPISKHINQICFQKTGLLFSEFSRLFSSLFENHDACLEVIRVLSTSKSGISRKELLSRLSLKSGAALTDRVKELIAAGFIEQYVPYGRKKRDKYYRVIDQYSLFYLKWIEPIATGQKRVSAANYWQVTMASQEWLSWVGYAFENVCLSHIDQIATKLGIESIKWCYGQWKYIPPKSVKKANMLEQGAQIDLLFDRNDGVITLCEVKYSMKTYVLGKEEAQKLMRRTDIFKQKYSTDKQIDWALISTVGVKKNLWSEELIDYTVSLDDLF